MSSSPQPVIWQPTARTQMTLDGFVVMHGGPAAMRLGEHEHRAVQIEGRFSQATLARGGAAAMPETFRLVPSGKPHTGSWRDGEEVIVLLLETHHLAAAAEELLRRTDFTLQEEVWGSDPLIQSVASVLRREFLSGIHDPLFLEALRTTVAGHLIRKFRNAPERPTEGRLSPRELRAVLEMIDAHLANGFTVASLAERCRMGVHRFTRLFQASTGFSPHQYVIDRRIQRAKQLLQDGSVPLAEVAYALGFASQSHFSTVFRRHVQLTPSEFRKQTRIEGTSAVPPSTA